MRHAVSRNLHERWEALRSERPAAGCVDIDPCAIRGVLASAFVLEAAAADPRGASFLLSGTRVDALFGGPQRGGSFAAIWSGRSRPIVAAALGQVLESARPAVAAARGGSPDRGEAAFELLLLPLGPGPRGRRRVLGSLAALRAPGWIGIAPAAPLEILAWRALRNPPERPRDAGAPVRVGRFTVHPGGRDRRSSSPGFKFSRP